MADETPTEIFTLILEFASTECNKMDCNVMFLNAKEKCKRCEMFYCSKQCMDLRFCNGCKNSFCRDCVGNCERCNMSYCGDCIFKLATLHQNYFYCSNCYDITYEEMFEEPADDYFDE